MKNLLLPIVITSCLFFSGINVTFGQAPLFNVKKSEIKVQRLTLMERFEPDMVLSADDRKALKTEVREDIVRKAYILDTLNISDRKKRKLLFELKYKPFSKKADDVILANTQFDVDAEVID